MPEMHLRQPGFTYNDCRTLIKNKERIQKIKGTGDSRCIYQNELDKACFQDDIASGDFKHLLRGTASDNILRDKAFNIGKNPNINMGISILGINMDLLQWFIFDKRSLGGGAYLIKGLQVVFKLTIGRRITQVNY